MERDRGGRPRHPDILTPAEWRVLEELRKGGTNAEIAVRLGISPDAVKYHISNMLGKLGLEDRHALAAWTPKRRARRLAGLLAVPSVFSSLGRTILLTGATLSAVSVAVVVAILLIALANDAGQEILPAVGGPGSATVSVGDYIACAIRETGEVTCWGASDSDWWTGAPPGSFRSISASRWTVCGAAVGRTALLGVGCLQVLRGNPPWRAHADLCWRQGSPCRGGPPLRQLQFGKHQQEPCLRPDNGGPDQLLGHKRLRSDRRPLGPLSLSERRLALLLRDPDNRRSQVLGTARCWHIVGSPRNLSLGERRRVARLRRQGDRRDHLLGV